MDQATPAPAIDMAAIYADMARMHEERAQQIRQQRTELLLVLQAAGIDSVEAHYDAYGDSGNVEDVTLLPELPEAEQPAVNEGELPLDQPAPRIPDPVMSRLQDMLWSTVYALHPGFENNDGGFGDITWDLAVDTMAIEHNERFTDYNSYSHEGV